ncbi:hypothetical protein GCM10017691_09010 [Pseudonocardia petroleophila]|uniref:Uncharacterized protein n=1 Tax=Pseudonocardia petroleophila TaxID=37331 RepID=A0A7G7MJE5_9PSEU|nr:hypothetical protein [Pseudonocardia petroleophila]QNG52906.1 hypothetical protein H6H00_02320 [Pseudonocardia petroleophila]
MVAEPVGGLAVPNAPFPADRSVRPVSQRRFVAVSVCTVELLRPGSDLVRLLEGGRSVDLLVACDDGPVAGPAPVGVLGVGDAVELDAYDDEWDDDREDDGVELRARAAELGLPDLAVHRLGLRSPLGPGAEDDLVAALSELVGFDPEPGVYLLGPAVEAGRAGVDRAVVDRAVQRIAQVYGIPLLRYRCHELTVVDAD